MYSSRSGLILGFHGCDLKIRDAIVSGELKFKKSTHSYNWLGDGAYFWENNFDRAIDFANEIANSNYNKQNILDPAVLGATIDLGNCLDLTDSFYLKMVKMSYDVLVEAIEMVKNDTKPRKSKKLPKKLPKNVNTRDNTDVRMRYLDCMVIENIHKLMKLKKELPFDTVRAAFSEGDKLYDGAEIHEKNHIQICIRNPNSIKNFFKPREKNNSKFPHKSPEI